MTDEEMQAIVEEDRVDDYIRKFRTNKHKCPPIKYIHSGGMKACFYCEDCYRAAFKYY